MRNRIYNVGAYGIPLDIKLEVIRLAQSSLPLNYTRHAMSEACHDRYGCLPASAFPRAFKCFEEWTLVEAETIDGELSKFVVRRVADAKRSLVLVITRDGFVRTLWTNLNSDGHATLNKERFDKP